MASPTVVEQLDVIEHIRSCFVAGCVDSPLDPITLEQSEEALRDQTGAEIDDDDQAEPALIRPDHRDVSNPGPNGPIRIELATRGVL